MTSLLLKKRSCSELLSSKVTPSMLECLTKLESSLSCPLCTNVMTDPVTLQCAHSFCVSCVKSHDSWTCPAKGCGMPRAMMIHNSGGWKLNPQLCSLVSSYQQITSLLDQAPSHWWKHNSPSSNKRRRRYSSTSTCTTAESSLPQDDSLLDNDNDNDNHPLDQDSEDLIDLQAAAAVHDKDDLVSLTEEEGQAANSMEEECPTPSPWKRALLSNTTISSILLPSTNKTKTNKIHTKTPSPWKRAAQSLETPAIRPTVHTDDWPTDEKTTNLVHHHHDEDDDDATQAYDIAAGVDDPLPPTQDSFPTHITTPSTHHPTDLTCSISMLDPNVSPIAFPPSPHPSQQTTTTTATTTTSSSLSLSAKPMLLLSSSSTIMDKNDKAMVQHYMNQQKINPWNETTVASCSFVISSQSVFETCDGFIVERSYPYLLALAYGKPLLDIRFLRDAYQHDPNLPLLLHQQKSYPVIGDVDASNWNGPQRSQQQQQQASSKKNNHNHNGLLHSYTVYLYGEYPVLAGSSRRRKAQSFSDTSAALYTMERITTLLQLCGATILTKLPDNNHHNMKNPSCIILIRPNPSLRDYRRAEKFLSQQEQQQQQQQQPSSIPILRANWLLDSIAEFMVQPLENYTKHNS